MALVSLCRRLCRPAGFLTAQRLCHSSSGTAVTEIEQKYELVTVAQAVTLPAENQRLLVKGWVQHIRKHKNVCFLHITDKISSELLQVVLPRDVVDDLRLTTGTSVKCRGELVQSPGHKQATEFQCKDFDVVSGCPPENLPYDISRDSYAWHTLRNSYTARPLVKSMRSVLRIRSSVITALYQFFERNGYLNITAPIITGNNCEGGSDVFSVSAKTSDSDLFFDKEAFLTVSGQLHLEAMVNAFGKVFTISPAFRAENNLSRRHVSEFTMLEVEESFIDELDILMDRAEELIRFVAQHVLTNCADDLSFLLQLPNEKFRQDYRVVERMVHRKRFLRLTYEDALQIVNKANVNADPLTHGQDLKRYHEQILTDYFEGYPLFVTHFPSNLKPFYMKCEGENALCFDLIVPVGGEIAGGSLREDNFSLLKAKIEGIGQSEALEWYADLRLMGSTPHGGFGMGLDRILQSIMHVANIRDTMPFPRWSHHLPL